MSFTLRRGEVLGVTGLAGSGLGELSKAIFGAAGSKRHRTSDVSTASRFHRGDPPPRLPPASRFSPATACARASFPSSRCRRTSACPCCRASRAFAGVLDQRGNDGDRRRAISRACNVRAPGPFAQARQLSGGNQQKVLFAKWLETMPKVFVMDEPTIGIDVGSKAEIRAIIDEIAATGVGIVLVTTELEELVSLCDRVLVMFRGATRRRADRRRDRARDDPACLGLRRRGHGGAGMSETPPATRPPAGASGACSMRSGAPTA